MIKAATSILLKQSDDQIIGNYQNEIKDAADAMIEAALSDHSKKNGNYSAINNIIIT